MDERKKQINEIIKLYKEFIHWMEHLPTERIDELYERAEAINANTYEERLSESSHYSWLDDKIKELEEQNNLLMSLVKKSCDTCENKPNSLDNVSSDQTDYFDPNCSKCKNFTKWEPKKISNN